ncbi:MAG: hypothetical protein WBO92_04510, partial [Candidatus Moraniibacteriota bacterium]
VAALLCAISVSAIIFSRRLRMYAMFFPLYLAAATAFYAAYESEYAGRIRSLQSVSARFGIHLPYLALGLVLLVLSLSVHQLVAHLPLSLGVYLFIRSIMTFRATGTWQNKYGYSVLFGLVALTGVALFAPKLIQSFTQGLVFFDDHFGYLTHALNDFATPIIGVGLISGGVWYLFRQLASRPAALYLSIAYALPLVMAVFLWRRNVGPQYIFFVQSFGMILAAAGIVATFELLRKMMAERWNRRAAIALSLGLFVLVPNLAYFLEENNTYHETSTGGNPNYRKVFAYFKKEKTADAVLITRNFRNYYWSGANTQVFDFGGELSKEKLSLADIQKIQAEHPAGWFIYSGNDEDYISSEVERFAEKNWERVSNANVRGDITVYHW